jgi:hypothetical protein
MAGESRPGSSFRNFSRRLHCEYGGKEAEPIDIGLSSFCRKFADKIKTYFLCSTNFFFENLSVYEIMWKNMAEPDRPQTAI